MKIGRCTQMRALKTSFLVQCFIVCQMFKMREKSKMNGAERNRNESKLK
jgi:hypothetical protein